MLHFTRLLFSRGVLSFALLTLMVLPLSAGPLFPPAGSDTFDMLGLYRILVEPFFRPFMAGYSGYNDVSYRLETPFLEGLGRIIRSNEHQHGSAADTGGTPVGFPPVATVADSDFSIMPPGFQGPVGAFELHMIFDRLNLTSVGGMAFRVGDMAPLQPFSPGEMEAVGGGGTTYPAESFFDVFFELDLPPGPAFPGGILYNSSALLLAASGITMLPPYPFILVHANPYAIPLFMRRAGPTGQWSEGDLFGWLVLGGQGYGPEFYDVMRNLPEMAPIPEPGSGALAALGLALLLRFIVRRQARRRA